MAQRRVKVSPEELLGLQEVAELLGVARETAWRWRSRDVLPEPFAVCSGVPIWTRTAIVAWAFRTNRLSRGDVRRQRALADLVTA